MKNLRERWRGLTVLGVVAFAAACMTVAPVPSFADIAGGGGDGGPITEWCSDGRSKTGLVRCEDGNLRYFDPETGAMVTNQWHNEYEAVWYYFGADGIAVSGWQSIGGDKYYFYPESHDMAYGRVQIDGKNYFLNTPGANADGRMQHSGWLYDSIYGKWFYATSSGELLTGWHNIGGTWYFFDEYGVMLTGWITTDGNHYYFTETGALTGLQELDGETYYFDANGIRQTGEFELDGKIMVFGKDGKLTEIREPSAAIQLNVPDYKQFGESWSNTKINYQTIGQVGCLVTCLSMKYSYQTGTETHPDDMLSKLTFSGDDLMWVSFTNLGYTMAEPGSASNCYRTIYEKLLENKPVIIGATKSNGSQHWVVVTGYTGDGKSFQASDFVINDPGSSYRKVLSEYLDLFPNLYKIVY